MVLRLTKKETDVLYTILRYQFAGEFDGGPISDKPSQAAALRILAKIERKA